MAQVVNPGMVKFGTEEFLTAYLLKHPANNHLSEYLKDLHGRVAKAFAGREMAADQIKTEVGRILLSFQCDGRDVGTFDDFKAKVNSDSGLRTDLSMQNHLKGIQIVNGVWVKMLTDSITNKQFVKDGDRYVPVEASKA